MRAQSRAALVGKTQRPINLSHPVEGDPGDYVALGWVAKAGHGSCRASLSTHQSPNARAMWGEEKSPCGVDLGFGEGAKVQSGGNGPKKDYNKKEEAAREARSGFTWGSTFFS